MNFTETGRLILKFHKTIRKNISSGILAESSIPQPVTVGYFCSQFFKDGRRTETDKQIKPPRAWRFKSPMWGFQYRWDRGSVYKILKKKKKKNSTTKCSAKTCSFIFSSKWNQSLREQNGSICLLPHESLRESQCHDQCLTLRAERSPCSCPTPACLHGLPGTKRQLCGFAVTRWRPRSRRAAEGASCLGGGGRKPVPSGRCLAYEGSPASSASGGTSGDPEEIFTLIWDKTPGACLLL